MKFQSSAPGSLMLLGEYAVLYGKYAVVLAINKRITVCLTPRSDDLIHIQSDTLGEYSTRLAKITVEAPFQFVLSALKQHASKLKTGCDIQIRSEFSDKVGLGSSAAVTVAMLSALFAWLKIKTTTRDLIKHSRMIIRAVQGVGSGADVAASVLGGMVGYQTQPLFIEKFSGMPALSLLYAGFKTKTVDAIKKVETQFAAHPQLLRYLQTSIGQCALEGMKCIQKNEWSRLGEIMNIQQGLMEALGVSLPLLRDMVEDLRAQPDMFGAKISGSGLGDCVIGLGELPSAYQSLHHDKGVEAIPIKMTAQGVLCEKI